jgi:hypothetical protein
MYSNSYVWAKIIRYLEDHLTAATTAGYFDDIEVIELTEEQLNELKIQAEKFAEFVG